MASKAVSVLVLYINLAVLMSSALAAVPVSAGMQSFGNAVKEITIAEETVMFEHTLSSQATHGAITQQWHAGGKDEELRVRVYVDGETTASIDYPVLLGHGGRQTKFVSPWGNGAFGRTHDSGFYNVYLIPFQKSVRVTLTPTARVTTWYMVHGMENAPLVVSGLQLPPASTRLHMQRTTTTASPETLVTFVNASNTSGLLRQLVLQTNSSNYAYQEGCVSAIVDQQMLWLSSGLEDYFFGAYFHSMPDQHLPYSGFALNAVPAPSNCTKALCTNALMAYRIHEHDPVLFKDSLQFSWIASSDNTDKEQGWCNWQGWPAPGVPANPPKPQPPSAGAVAIDAIAWYYTWDAVDAA